MVTRRDAAAFIGALGLGASAAPEWRTAKAAEPHALPVSPEEQNDALVRILGRTDEGESVWQSSSKIFALTENGVVPLLETRGGQRSWWRSEDGGIYRRFPAALNYFVDPVTGAFIDEFKNPITGRTTPLVSTVERRKDGEVFTPTGSYFPVSRQKFPDMYEDKPLSLDWRLDNNSIRLLLTQNFAPVAPRPIYEVHTYFAPASEALDRSRTTVQASSSGWFTAKFSRWLDMADVDGFMLWHFEGTKLNSIDDLDEDYLSRARARTDNFDVSPEFDSGPSYIEEVQKKRQDAD
jgi:hypothetical protein